ncbi:MAG TPA: serine/threonine-protein kinase [Kiritimatiellia bacterium]|nr:serine/threonine-protein kinase [Kiritimatiellia bacterium]
MATRLSKLACSRCGHELDVLAVEPFSNVVCPECQTEMTVPVMLGPFLLVERLGAGGMGAVYRALDATLNRFVAIKVLKTALGEDAKLYEGFLKEARAAAALNHRNIVQIYSCGQENGQPYIAMELVAGGRLDQMIGKPTSLSETRILEIALDVAEGLRAAHDVGLIHSDIKPANILIDPLGTAKIVDFGLAQFVSAQQDKGEIWGTPYYISPERARGAAADHRSDIYSLGATLFHAFTGQVPFDGKTAVDVVLARLKQPPPDLSSLRPGLQSQTIALVNRMMAVDSVMRYPTSASLMADMRSALHAARAAEKSPGHRHSKQASKGSRWIAVAGIAAGIGVVAGIAMWVQSLPKDEPVVRPAPRPAAARPAVETEGRALEAIFTPEMEGQLALAADHLARGRTGEANGVYRGLAEALSRNDARLLWIPVLQAVPLWLDREDMRAMTQISQVAERRLSMPDDNPVHMPRILAGRLSGRLTEEEFAAASAPWPEWFGDLAIFYQGLMRFRTTRGQQGLDELVDFADTGPDAPMWVAAYRGVGRAVVDEVRGWRLVERRITAWLEAGDAQEAMLLIEQMSDRPSRFVDQPLGELRARAARFIKEQEGQAAVVVEVVDHAGVQRDLDRLNGSMVDFSALLLRNRDYRRVGLSLGRLTSEMETEQGREALGLIRDRVEGLEAFRSWLIEQVQQLPYTRAEGSDLGGDVIGANPVGLRISTDGRTGTIRPWEEIPLRSLLRMGSFYAGRGRMSAEGPGVGWSLLALFSYMNGGPEVAVQFAERAVAADPGLRERLRRWMPDVLPQEQET